MSEQQDAPEPKPAQDRRISIASRPGDRRISIATVASANRVVPSERRISCVTLGSSSKGGIKSSSRLRMRRKSFGFSGVAGVRPIDRSSTTAIEYRRPQLIYLPTYQMESSKPFDVDDVTIITNKVLDILFTGHKYSPLESPQMAMSVASEIMRRCKDQHYNRYRIVTVVTVGQKRAQSYNNAISFIWDHERDRYVDAHREMSTVFIQATVFGIYLD